MDRIVGSIVTERGVQPFVLEVERGAFEVGRYAEPDPAQAELSVIQQQRFVQLISERASVSFAQVRLGQYRCPSCGRWVAATPDEWAGETCTTCAAAKRPQAAAAPPEAASQAPEPERVSQVPTPPAAQVPTPAVVAEEPAEAVAEALPAVEEVIDELLGDEPSSGDEEFPGGEEPRPVEGEGAGTLLERAVAIAVEAHRGQTDRAGQPYILHPLRMMVRMDDAEAQMAAALHDVVEDSAWTLDDLRREGFPDVVVAAVEALTKREDEDEPYEAYVERAAQHPLARRVKRADLEDNMNVLRLGRPLGAHDLARLERYRKAWHTLRAWENEK